MLWVYVLGYGLPTWSLLLMYVRISWYIRHQSHVQNIVVRSRQARDLVVIQRTMLLIGILFVLALPGTILLLIYYITGYECPVGYRLQSATLQISLFVLSILMIFMTPKLKNTLMAMYKKTIVVPMNVPSSFIIQSRIHALYS